VAGKSGDDPKRPDRHAPISDVAIYGDIDITKDYPPGTHFQMPDGTTVDMNAVADYLGGDAPPPEPPPEPIGPGAPPR
jgi:hypothetical protein